MSQREFLAGLDAALHASFASAGMADVGAYMPPDAEPSEPALAVRVYVDRNVQQIGEFGQVSAARVEVSFVRADVAPVKGARLDVDGDTYITVEPIAGADDGSSSRWVVRRG